VGLFRVRMTKAELTDVARENKEDERGSNPDYEILTGRITKPACSLNAVIWEKSSAFRLETGRKESGPALTADLHPLSYLASFCPWPRGGKA
jgi:hypothetical protein